MRILIVLIAFLVGGVAGGVVGKSIYVVKVQSRGQSGAWIDRHLDRQNWILGGALAGGFVGAAGAAGAMTVVDRRRNA